MRVGTVPVVMPRKQRNGDYFFVGFLHFSVVRIHDIISIKLGMFNSLSSGPQNAHQCHFRILDTYLYRKVSTGLANHLHVHCVDILAERIFCFHVFPWSSILIASSILSTMLLAIQSAFVN